MLPREYSEHGRIKRDSVAQPLRDKTLANKCAEILQRMTGDECMVVPRFNHYYVMRNVGERWVRA